MFHLKLVKYNGMPLIPRAYDYDRVYRVKFNRPLNKETFKIRSTQHPSNTPPAFMYRAGFLVKALSSVEFIRPTLRAWRACFCHIQTY